jgi:lysophospholipase L1-like esterase
VAGRSRLAPEAPLHHSPSLGRDVDSRASGLSSEESDLLGPALPLGTLPLGTYVTNQFAKDGIVFSGQEPFVTDDPNYDAAPFNPALSGSPQWYGTIVGEFVKPGTQTPAAVDEFSINIGGLDTPGSTQMTVYNLEGQQLGVLVATDIDQNTSQATLVSSFPGAASFSVEPVNPADPDPAGWDINTIRIGPIVTDYIAMGDSYTSGEGSDDFPWSTAQGTQCDTGPEAWPVQMADNENAGSTGALLVINQNSLVACQGEETSDLGQAVNGESASELAQVTNFVSDHGPPDLVTITIGGNDVGFGPILTRCFLLGALGCFQVIDALNTRLTTGSASLIATLSSTYTQVLDAADGGTGDDDGDGPQVVVVGYPNLFPQPGGLGTALSVFYNCPWLGNPVNDPLLLAAFADAQAALNDDIAQAAAEAGVQFVPIPGSLAGHELCTGTPYINPVSLKGAVNRNVGHPNVAGLAAIANAVGSALGLATGGSDQGARDGQRFRASRPVRPGIRPSDTGPLSFSGGQLLGGTVGAEYVSYLVATGGNGADTWSITSGSLPPGLSLDPDAGTITGTPTTPGDYTFTAQATDSSSPPQTASASVTIDVAAATPLSVGSATPPDATAGQLYTSQLAATGGLGMVSWVITSGALPAGLALDSATGQLTGTPTTAAVGTSTFTVQATDSSSPAQVATGSVSITVDPASDPLTVTTTSLPGLTAGQDYSAQLTSTGGVAPVVWSVSAGSLPPGLSLDPASGLLSGTPTVAGTYDFTAQVTDGTSPVPQTATAHLSITIGAPPALSISTASAFDGTEGSYYSSTFQATGGVGSYYWYVSSGSLPAGLSLNSATGQVTGIPSGTGTSSFGVTVADASGITATQSYSVTIAQVPLTVSSALAPATVGTYYAGNVTPSGGLAPYGWSLVSGTLPSGLGFDPATGTITGTPTQSGSFPLQVLVTDSSSPAQQVTADVTLTVAARPSLTLSSSPPLTGAVAAPYVAGIGWSGGQAPYTWAITSGTLPPGLSMDPGSGMVTGTPTAAGAYPVTVQVTDSSTPTPEVATTSVTFTIVNSPKLAISATLPLATQGISYTGTLAVTGGVPPYSQASIVSGALPAGLTLNPSSGQISGTPTSHGTSSFTAQVTDSGSPPATAEGSFKLTVNAGAPLSIMTTGLVDATQYSPYAETLSADGGVGPYTWKVLHGALPAGLTLTPGGYLSGTPTRSGSSSFTVQATDQDTPKAGVATEVLSLNVWRAPLSPPSFIYDSPPSLVAMGSPYSYGFAAWGNPAPTFSVSSGQLPPGLTLGKTTGLLSGTATSAGTYSFEVTASNGRSPAAVSPPLPITVVSAPVITSFTPTNAVSGAQVVITGENLQNASSVSFGASHANIASDTASKIVTSVPDFAGSGPIYVDTPGGSVASASSFTVDPPPVPVITSISPTSGSGGITLTITGTGLEAAYEVAFTGGDVAYDEILSDTATKIRVPVPLTVQAGPVIVYTDGGQATSTQTFTPTG